MSPPNEEKKKDARKVQPTLFGIKKFELTQKATRRIGKNQFKVVGEFVQIERGEKKKDVFPHKCRFCHAHFKTRNALGAHQVHCAQKKEQDQKQAKEPINEKSCVILKLNYDMPHKSRNHVEKDMHTEETSCRTATITNQPTSKSDKRINNHGAAVRKSYSVRYKVAFVDQVNEYVNEFSE